MIHASPELCAIVRRTLAAARDLDAETLRGVYSKHPALRYVGSELDEVFGGDIFRQGVVDHFAEGPRYRQIEEALEAYESGKAGWALWRGLTIFEDDGQEVQARYRISFVFVLEEGSWKIVQVHLSNPDSKFESLGVPNETMKALEAAAQEEELGLGASGMASIMFTDVVDSSALADLVGDKQWAHRIDAHLEQVRLIVEAEGGKLVKSLGDGTMSTFTSTRAALKAAREIQAQVQEEQAPPDLHLRIGLHTGEVIENKGDFFGTVVNKAARVVAAAAPGQILVTDATRIMVGGARDVTFGDSAELQLKGLEGTHVVHTLTWQT